MFLFSGFDETLWIAVLEEQLMTSHHEVEGDRPGKVPRTRTATRAWPPEPGGRVGFNGRFGRRCGSHCGDSEDEG